MAWPLLGAQFCLQLAFGVVLSLAFVRSAPLGAFFYRLAAVTAATPVLAALLLAPVPHRVGDPATLTAAVGLLATAALALGPRNRARWRTTLAVSIAALAASSAAHVHAAAALPPAELALASTSALATGAVAGGVGMAMVLGHWYLTVPKLDVAYLARMNRLTVVAMIVSAALLALSCFVFAERLAGARTPLSSPFGVFHFATRITVGLALPLLFAWMTAGALAYKNTRSATGILYASTVLVLIGAAASISLQQSYGVPL